MKKALIGVLSLGLVIGVGAVGAKSFANEEELFTPGFTNNVGAVESNVNQNSSNQGESGFKVLNEETNQFETLDDSGYRNNNSDNSRGCPHMGYRNYGDSNQFE